MLAERLAAQLLSGSPALDVPSVVRHLLAVQAQDARGFRLAVRARSTRLCAADVDRALSEERSVVVSWLCRGTLHLVASEDFFWLHELTTPPLAAANLRRLAQEGVSPDAAGRAVDAIERALAGEGPLTRQELADRVAAAGVPVAGQAIVHVLFCAVLRGVAVRGPVIGGRHAYVLVRDWIGPPPPSEERERALGELARRYLLGHGPATDRDLARWAGLPLRDARAGLQAISPALVHRGEGAVSLRGQRSPAGLPPPRLLGSFDPLLVGWTDRGFITGEHDAAMISGGLFRPFALVEGRPVATWRLRNSQVVLDEPFAAVSPEATAALAEDAAALCRYLGL